MSGEWLFTGLAFLLLPAAILTLHKQKSEFVLGVLVPGVVLLVLWFWHQLCSRIEFRSAPAWRLPMEPNPGMKFRMTMHKKHMQLLKN